MLKIPFNNLKGAFILQMRNTHQLRLGNGQQNWPTRWMFLWCLKHVNAFQILKCTCSLLNVHWRREEGKSQWAEN